MIRFVLFIAILTSTLGYSGEQEFRKPGTNPFPLWASAGGGQYIGYDKAYDYNKWLYSLCKTTVDIYGNSAKSEEEKIKVVNNLIVPSDKIMLKISATNVVEKEIYSQKMFVLEAVVDYGEPGIPPVKCYIYSLREPKDISIMHKTQRLELPCVIAKVSRSTSRTAPALTLRCITQETADWFAVNCPYVK